MDLDSNHHSEINSQGELLFESELFHKIREEDLVKFTTTDKEYSNIEKRIAQALVTIESGSADPSLTEEN